MFRQSTRPSSNPSLAAEVLSAEGIISTAPLYNPENIARINAAMDPIFAGQIAEPRAYVTVADMARLGLLEMIVGGAMRHLLLSIMPDPMLFHCHASEIAANNTKSHIYGNTLAGWHRDVDCEYFKGNVTHVSIFVYLTEVGPQDGPFEFCPLDPKNWIHSRSPALSVTGPAGSSFAWNRAFYHRAAPNRGPRRRRLIKLSVQPNRFASSHLEDAPFQIARQIIPPGNLYLDTLLGRYQTGSPPELSAWCDAPVERMAPTGTIDVSNSRLAKAQARDRLRDARRWLRRKSGRQPETGP